MSVEGHAEFVRNSPVCRFSSFLSLGIALTCADVERLIDLSSGFSHQSVIFLGDRRRHPPGSGQRRSSDWNLRPSRRVAGSWGQAVQGPVANAESVRLSVAEGEVAAKRGSASSGAVSWGDDRLAASAAVFPLSLLTMTGA